VGAGGLNGILPRRSRSRVRASGSFDAARVAFRTARCVNNRCDDFVIFSVFVLLRFIQQVKRLWRRATTNSQVSGDDAVRFIAVRGRARRRRLQFEWATGARSRKSEPVLGRGARQPRHRDADTRPAAYRGGLSACNRPGLPTFPSLVHSRKRSILRRRSIRRRRRRASSRFTTLPIRQAANYCYDERYLTILYDN